jgi:DNA replication licensing factor MCM6
MRDDDRTTLYVDFQHLEQHSVELADAIVSEFYYLESQLRAALHGVMSRHHPEAVAADKEYTVSFYNMSTLLRVRDMKSDCVGKLLRRAPPHFAAFPGRARGPALPHAHTRSRT